MSFESPTEREKLAAEQARRPDLHDFLFINGRAAYVYACVEGENRYVLSVIWLDNDSRGDIKYSTMTRVDSIEGLPKGKIAMGSLESLYHRSPEKLNNLQIPVILAAFHNRAIQDLSAGQFAGFYTAETEQ